MQFNSIYIVSHELTAQCSKNKLPQKQDRTELDNKSILVRFFLRAISDASTLPRLVNPLIIPPKSGML